jgi:hypothetical protein
MLLQGPAGISRLRRLPSGSSPGQAATDAVSLSGKRLGGISFLMATIACSCARPVTTNLHSHAPEAAASASPVAVSSTDSETVKAVKGLGQSFHGLNAQLIVLGRSVGSQSFQQELVEYNRLLADTRNQADGISHILSSEISSNRADNNAGRSLTNARVKALECLQQIVFPPYIENHSGRVSLALVTHRVAAWQGAAEMVRVAEDLSEAETCFRSQK